jgi:hypothetical protein
LEPITTREEEVVEMRDYRFCGDWLISDYLQIIVLGLAAINHLVLEPPTAKMEPLPKHSVCIPIVHDIRK